MIVQCPQCDARYNYPDERFGERTEKKVRCFRCEAVFEVRRSVAEPSAPQAAETPPAPVPAPQPDPGGEPFEITQKRRNAPVPAESSAEEEEREAPPKKRKRRVAEEEAIAKITAAGIEAEPKLPEGYRLSLAVINGPDAGKVFRIEKPRIVIGRTTGDLVLSDSEASRTHAAIEVREKLVLLEDLGSRNGTYHRGKTVDVPLPLHNHSEFIVGNTTLMLIVTRD